MVQLLGQVDDIYLLELIERLIQQLVSADGTSFTPRVALNTAVDEASAVLSKIEGVLV